MGQLDITEKILADYNDVFADIVNGLLFDGKQIVSAKSLKNVKDKSMYKADDTKIHEMERDLSKVVTDKGIEVALVGLENQTEIDSNEPLRCIGYDGSAYRSQLNSEKKKMYPVVTLVLYFGLTPWNKSKSLYERLEIGEEWKSYVNDYKINLFEIAFLEPEQVALFKSDFKIVADYFVQMRMNNDYVPKRETIQHVDELLKLMSVLTKDTRFKEVQNKLKCEGGNTTMCEVLDRIVAEGEARGEARAYYKMGLSIDEIAKKMSLSQEKVKELLNLQ